MEQPAVKNSCRYCHRPFQMKKKNQEFCCPEHRALFWKHGSMTYEKLWAQFERKIAAELAPLRVMIAAADVRLTALERPALDTVGYSPDQWDEIRQDAEYRAKRGGGAAA